ncbi:MAG TPA: hypothetical protein VIG76_05005 [Amnibacterium sp.]|jgi:hypothetical protein|uniref:hypothetical protein n=1 Tax=Amnibacterium sp. TaxID=1872496 RepID=UPI002F94CD08
MVDGPFDASTLESIGELLALAQTEGFGLSFSPDPDGWTIGYVRGMSGDNLVSDFDLGAAARKAVAGLLDVAASHAQAGPDPADSIV